MPIYSSHPLTLLQLAVDYRAQLPKGFSRFPLTASQTFGSLELRGNLYFVVGQTQDTIILSPRYDGDGGLGLSTR